MFNMQDYKNESKNEQCFFETNSEHSYELFKKEKIYTDHYMKDKIFKEILKEKNN
ncbi:hypothetical protein [Oceanirhabdus seepicola]|uniref:Uncharacterized protein n=1 Tax=Oceanirhabdus seepicola TaxID=2828781 RepID=A0A9J6P3C7_9CLOT|nr:hypothetical protein [Oceanirhabdus seepicola]MCM1991306.1 hypothetical protein [Oceanirhabdus seepicola]